MRFTTEWLAARQAKSANKLQDASGNCEKESDLHRAISAYCKQRGWIADHGSMAHRALRTIGEQDFTIWADRGRVFAIECKTRTGKLSTEQLGRARMMEMNGHTVHVVRSMEQFLEIVQ
jgi:hypothetical protein